MNWEVHRPQAGASEDGWHSAARGTEEETEEEQQTAQKRSIERPINTIAFSCVSSRAIKRTFWLFRQPFAESPPKKQFLKFSVCYVGPICIQMCLYVPPPPCPRLERSCLQPLAKFSWTPQQIFRAQEIFFQKEAPSPACISEVAITYPAKVKLRDLHVIY